MQRGQNSAVHLVLGLLRKCLAASALLFSSLALAGGGEGAGMGGPAYTSAGLQSHGPGVVGWGAPVVTGNYSAASFDQMLQPSFALSSLGVIAVRDDGTALYWPRGAANAAGQSGLPASPLRVSGLLSGMMKPAIAGAPSGFFVVAGTVGAKASPNAYFVRVTGAGASQGAAQPLPALPEGIEGVSAQLLGDRLYVAGSSGRVVVLDVAEIAQGGLVPANRAWRVLPGIGAKCSKAWLARQYDGVTDQMHLACLQSQNNANRLLVAKLSEQGGRSTWLLSKPVEIPGEPVAVLAQGQSNLLAFVSQAGGCGEANCKLRGAVQVYNTVIKRWRTLEATYPGNTPPVLLGADNRISAVSIEAGRFSLSEFGFLIPAKRFGWIDMSVIAAYLLGMVLVGLWFKSRNTSTEEFFRGGQSIPWWAAALSIHAALLSSLTYLGLPALVYRTSWIMFMGMIILIFITPVIVYWVMPFFRRIDATSAYQYLSMRFNMPIRQMASALFALFHIGRMAIVLSLAGLALASVTPLEPWQSVLLMGVLSISYSTMGGVEAVVWTEALQTLVLSTGALVCFLFLLNGIDGGMSSYVSMGLAEGKFDLVDWNFSHGSWMTFSIWVIVLGGIGQNLSTYGADQAVIQRYLVTSTEKKAASAIWLNAVTTAPSGIIFFLIGTGLYYFYQAHPERLDPSIQIDQIFPTFIANEVPTGAAGLIIAGVFAATQSAVATSMHSISTTMVVDFLRPSGINWSDEKQLTAARWFTVLVGGLGTAIGLVFIDPAIRSLFEAYMAVVGMSMGALGGLFLAGMTTRRVNSLSAFLGLVTGVVIMIALWRYNAINPYLFSAIGVFSCYGFAWLFSFVAGRSDKDLTNLTVHTMDRSRPVGAAE